MKLHLVLAFLFSVWIGNTFAMYYTAHEQSIVQQAVAHDDIDSFTQCLTDMICNCVIDREFRNNPELCIKPLQEIFNDVWKNPNFLKVFLDTLIQHSSILEKGLFFLPEALLKGYKKLEILSWMEQVARHKDGDPACMTVLIDAAHWLLQQNPRLEGQVTAAFQSALQQALSAQNLDFAATFIEQGARVESAETETKKEFASEVIWYPTLEKLHFCVNNNALTASEWKKFAYRPEGWNLLRSTYSLSELKDIVGGIKNLFSCIVYNNDMEAARELLRRHRSSLMREIRTNGAAWLCIAAGKRFFEFADFLVSLKVDVEKAFVLSLGGAITTFWHKDVKEFCWPTLEYETYEFRYQPHNAHRYFAPKFPAKVFFNSLANISVRCMLEDVIRWQIRINDRQQREELVEYLLQYPVNADDAIGNLLTSDLSQKIMRKENVWCNGQKDWFFYLRTTQEVTKALFLAIFWEENELFHQIFEKYNPQLLIWTSLQLGWKYQPNLFEWAVSCKNMALAKDIFLLNDSLFVKDTREEMIHAFKARYWNSQEIDEFMRFVDAVRELK